MYNQTAYALGANRSAIRDLFEYGRARAAIVGPENVYDYSLGNPSIPAPPEVNDAIRQILAEMDPKAVHGYSSAVGDLATRKAIVQDLNRRYGTDITPEELFMGCGAAGELCAVFQALATPGSRILAIAPYFPEYGPFVRGAGADFDVVPADLPVFQIDVDALSEKLTGRTCAMFISDPYKPAGAGYTRETEEKGAER